MKLKRKLSPAVIDELRPAGAPYRVWDTVEPALFIRIQPSGIRSWNVQYARSTSRSLGKWPGLTVEAARTRARNALIETTAHGKPIAVIERGKPKPKTLRDFVEQEYRPWAEANQKWGGGSAARILAQFADFADTSLDGLEAKAVEDWRTKRLQDGVGLNTCNRDLAALKSAMAKAKAWKFIAVNPLIEVQQAKVDSTRKRYLSDAEERRLRKALANRDANGRDARARANDWRAERGKEKLKPLDYSDHLTPAVLLSLNTGLRRGELTQLEWPDIDFNARSLTVRAAASKSGKRREIPLNAEAVDILKRWKKQIGGEGRLFPFYDLKTAWTALLVAAKIANLRWHDLRHTFASKLVNAGVDLNAVRELLGHADLKMTLRYSHSKQSHLANAVARLASK